MGEIRTISIPEKYKVLVEECDKVVRRGKAKNFSHFVMNALIYYLKNKFNNSTIMVYYK